MPRKPLGSDPIPWTSEDPRKQWNPDLATLWKLGQFTYVSNSGLNSAAIQQALTNGAAMRQPMLIDGESRWPAPAAAPIAQRPPMPRF